MLLFSLIDQILVNAPFILFGFVHFVSSFFFKGFGLSGQILSYLPPSILCQRIFLMFLSHFKCKIGESFLHLLRFFFILFSLFNHYFLLMLKRVFNISFLVLNYFIPSSSFFFLLLKHHIVCATAAASLESLSLHGKAGAVRIRANSSILLSSLDSLRSGIHLSSLVQLLFIVISVTIFKHSFFCLHSQISERTKIKR